MSELSPSIAVRTDFAGASLDVQRVHETAGIARLREEEICYADGARYDYNWHFAFAVENLSAAPLTAEVLINCEDSSQLPPDRALLFGSSSPAEEFSQIDIESRTDAKKSYAVWIPLGANEIRYIANYLFRPYDYLVDVFDRLGQAGGASRTVIGHTVEGRELVAYGYTRAPRHGARRAAIVMTSGVHPPEPDTLGSQGIMEYLATPAAADVREHVDLHLVPLMNPDGFVHGYNGCNAHQINFYWRFDTQNAERCPEAYHLWRYLEGVAPIVYFDWHGYTFQRGAKHAAPYIKPVVLHAGRVVRRLVRRVNQRVIRVAGGPPTTGFLTYAPSTLAAQVTSKFNTLTFAKYHLELRLGIAKNKQLAVDSLRAVVDTLSAEGFLDPALILKEPYGAIGDDPIVALGRRFLLWWGGRARPALGRIRRRLVVRA